MTQEKKKEILKSTTSKLSQSPPINYERAPPMVLATRDGHWQLVKEKWNLSFLMKHIYQVSKNINPNEPFQLTSFAYYLLNRTAGISIIKPPTIMDQDGNPRPNPWIEKDNEGNIKCVTIRKIGIGYTAHGSIALVDITFPYEPERYLRQELMSKIRKWDNDKVGPPAKLCKKQTLTEDEKDNGPFYMIDPSQSVGLWIDMRDERIKRVFINHYDRLKFIERFVNTVADTQVLKKHPALGISTVMAKAEKEVVTGKTDFRAVVEVYGFTHTETTAEMLAHVKGYGETAKRVADMTGEKLDEKKAVELRPDQVKVEAHRVEADEVVPEVQKEHEIEEGAEAKAAGNEPPDEELRLLEKQKEREKTYINQAEQKELKKTLTKAKMQSWPVLQRFIKHTFGEECGETLRDIKRAWLPKLEEQIEVYAKREQA